MLAEEAGIRTYWIMTITDFQSASYLFDGVLVLTDVDSMIFLIRSLGLWQASMFDPVTKTKTGSSAPTALPAGA